jgi:hypothetical protein
MMAHCRPQASFTESSKKIFSSRMVFHHQLGPQVSPSPVPFFAVNRSHSCRSKPPRRFSSGSTSPSQCSRRRCSDRRKRSWIEQICSKFLLQSRSEHPRCHMDLPRPTTSVGTRTDYSVGPWDYLTCAARHLMA